MSGFIAASRLLFSKRGGKVAHGVLNIQQKKSLSMHFVECAKFPVATRLSGKA
jgi:hypothetical protein